MPVFRFALYLLVLSSFLSAQTATSSDGIIRNSVHEVVLDVVVRHKNMKPENKLAASDFTITEDGVPQMIRSFRFVGGKEAEGETQPLLEPAAKALTEQANTLRTPHFVSVVLGDMGMDSKRNAVDAVKALLRQQLPFNTYAAIFRLGDRLHPLTNFTNNNEILHKALLKAMSASPSDLATLTASVLNQTIYTTTGGPGGITTTPAVSPTRSPDLATTSAGESPLSESNIFLARMITAQQNIAQYMGGERTLRSLLQMVRYESAMPGRRTVLYLADGLILPPDRSELMRAVISAANQADVTFYCVDVRGLMLSTSNGASSGLTASAAELSQRQANTASRQAPPPSVAMQEMQESDTLESSLASHSQLAMEELANATGGFAVFNTNEFRKPVNRMMEAARSHYEISYVPTSTVYDGHFRKIKISLKDPKLLLQSRKGYYAMPDLNGPPLTLYELDGMQALQRQGPQNEFDFRLALMRFGPRPNGFNYEFTFEVPIAALTMPIQDGIKAAKVHAIFLALIKDAQGQVVQRVSNETSRNVPQDKLEQFRRGSLVVTEAAELPPGRYTVDAVVVDPEGKRVSKRKYSLVVGRPAAPVISSLLVAKSVEATRVRDFTNPLEFDGGRVTPNISQKTTATAETVLFFVLYPKEGEEKPKISVQFVQDGGLVSQTEPKLGEPDQSHSIPVIAVAKLQSGHYNARVTMTQGTRTSREQIAIEVN